MIVIGLTGGIASGKSTAARYLAEQGAVMIDADRLGHRAYEPGRQAFERVVEAFGKDIVADDGTIDRRALGGRVFGDPAQLDRLTGIVWPEILAMASEEIEAARAAGRDVVVLEAAVLLEAGWEDAVDEVWVVTVDRATAIDRATSRDGVDEAAIAARIDAQLTNDERKARADIVLDNAGTESELVAQLDREWSRLVADEPRAATPAT